MSNWNLDDKVLESYINAFYGHGSYAAKYWFIGMEFGGGGSEAEIVSRIQSWNHRGARELEDLAGPKGIAEGARWFRPPYPLQSTWAKLIRVLLNAEGVSPTSEDIRLYQRERLGREDGADCILELLPLPSPGLGRWQFYPEHSKLSYLRDRATYTNHAAPARIAHLQQRIAEHCPRTVIFYGAGYEHWWRAISGLDLEPSSLDKVLVARSKHTTYVMMQHPTAHGQPKSYFDAVGRLIADHMQGSRPYYGHRPPQHFPTGLL